MKALPQVSTTKPKRAPKLREARLEDYEQIAALESRFGLTAKPYNEWVHLWQGNPVYRELKTDWPIGWVFEDQDGKIVASVGNIPLLYELDGRRILVASSRSWVADVEYRSVSLLLLDNLIRQRQVDLFLSNTVGDKAVAAITAYGCSPISVGIWDEVAYWITNYRGFFESIVAMKNYRLTRPFAFPSWEGSWTRLKALRARLSKPLSYPLSAAAFLKDRLAKTSVREGEVEVKPCTDFDDRFDSFWEDVKRNNRHLLLAVRTREVLEWHFKYALLGNRLWIVTAVDGPRLVAYAIFEKSVNPRSGFKQVNLVDYLSLEDGTSMLEPLLAWTLRRCRSEGVHVLEHTGRWMEKGEFIETAAPYRRKLGTWSYFYHTNNPELRVLLNSRQVWTPSLFDGDATL
ncbi:MAG: hypothetical protein DMG17_29210 [Acidobacteria bacterium]|nr:MAG: hypothetical protein DMG17_29210 [Acidobacteriota bacterium]